MKRKIPFYVPWITEDDRKAVLSALGFRWLTGGPKVAEFEELFATYVGVDHAVAVNSCTAALHLTMRALNIKTGDEVIVPTMTFAASANAALFCSAKPVLADVDEKTLNVSPQDLQNRITQRTKAILVVHYGGQPCDMKEIREIAEDHKVSVIEDCAHSLGATYRDRQTGSIGEAGCFSFYPTKIITTLEGGMLTTNSAQIAQKARILREHGMNKTAIDRESLATWHYDVTDLGYNYRLTEVQASLGISQLKRVEDGIDRRIRLAQHYTKELNTSFAKEIISPHKAKKRSHVFHLYTVKIKKETLGVDRDTLFRKLMESNIQPSVHYTPLHLMSYYRKLLKIRPGAFPVAERLYSEIISLPLYPTMMTRDIDFVIGKIGQIAKKKKSASF